MTVLNQRYQRNDDFVFRRIDDEAILVPIVDNVGDMGAIYTLNDVAALIWELLDGQKTLDDIRNNIVAEFEVSRQDARLDLCAFISQMATLGAVVAAG